MNSKLLLLVPFVLVALAMIVSSIPLILGRVAPNPWYGFRVKRTLGDSKIWYPVNRYAAYHLLAVGVVFLLVSISLYLVPAIGFTPYSIACVGVILCGLAVVLIRSFRYLSRL